MNQQQTVVLKLNKVGTYVSPLIENQLLEKDQTVRVTAKDAAHMLKGEESGKGEDTHPHFKVVEDADEDTEVTIDAVALRAQRMEAEREAKGLPPATLHRREAAEAARHTSADDEDGQYAPTARRSIKRAAPDEAKKAPAKTTRKTTH